MNHTSNFILLLLSTMFLSTSLSADIKYKGDCLGYYIDVDIQHRDFKDLYCYSNEMLSWNSAKDRYYRVIPIAGDVYTGLSFQTIDNNGRYKEVVWINVPKDNINVVKDSYKWTLLGLIVGFTVMFLSISFLGNI